MPSRTCEGSWRRPGSDRRSSCSGASFGGLLAYLYANEYPEDVVGMVLLDSMFPDEMALEGLFPPGDRYEAFDASDESEGLERISHFKVQQAAQAYIGHEPVIPVTYLASTTQGYDVNDYGIPEYDERILELQRATSIGSPPAPTFASMLRTSWRPRSRSASSRNCGASSNKPANRVDSAPLTQRDAGFPGAARGSSGDLAFEAFFEGRRMTQDDEAPVPIRDRLGPVTC